jgi:hypothetical protein
MTKPIFVRCEVRAILDTLAGIRRAIPKLALRDLPLDIRLPAATKTQIARLERELKKFGGRASIKA